jgi:hypothetical protein
VTVPPTEIFLATPTPPETTNAPVEVLVDSVVFVMLVAPVSVVAPPTLSLPPTPTPPETTKAPVEVLVDSAVPFALILLTVNNLPEGLKVISEEVLILLNPEEELSTKVKNLLLFVVSDDTSTVVEVFAIPIKLPTNPSGATTDFLKMQFPYH